MINKKVFADHQSYQAIRGRISEKLNRIEQIRSTLSLDFNALQSVIDDAKKSCYKELSLSDAEAAKKYQQLACELRALHDEVYLESYGILAKTIGLSGFAEDVGTYVSIPSKYDKAQPLVSYKDLCVELKKDLEKHGGSPLLTDFYMTSKTELSEENTALKHAIQCLDVRSECKFFQHKCVFSFPTGVMQKNTLYVEVQPETIRCTVLSPYNEILFFECRYDELDRGVSSFSHYRFPGGVQRFVLEHTSDLLEQIYLESDLYLFDAFSHMIDSASGFREHVHHTMVRYNQALIQKHGWQSMPLTKTHLYLSKFPEKSALEQTRWGIAQAEYRQKMSDLCASSNLLQETELNKKLMNPSVLEAKRLYQEKAQEAQKLIDDISEQLEWDWIELKIIAESQVSHDVEGISPVEAKKDPAYPTRPFHSLSSCLDRQLYRIAEVDENNGDEVRGSFAKK